MKKQPPTTVGYIVTCDGQMQKLHEGSVLFSSTTPSLFRSRKDARKTVNSNVEVFKALGMNVGEYHIYRVTTTEGTR